MASEYNSSDLTSILNTLSALSNPAAQAQNQYHGHHGYPPQQEPEDDPYEPADTVPAAVSITSQPRPQPHIYTTNTNYTPPKPPAAAPAPTDHPDPSLITTWPPALRHVMRTVAQNEALQRRIRRLLQSQHDHEKQWWDGREGLCRKQMARVEKKRELDEVLRSVGAPVDSKAVSTAEEDKAELNNYDTKIYSASKQMAQALMLELRGLGVPFFSIKRDLVSDGNTDGGINDKQHMLTRDELSDLQRRMLELLLDLCKE